MPAIAAAAAAAAAGKWMYYLAIEGKLLDYVTNLAHGFDTENATTLD